MARVPTAAPVLEPYGSLPGRELRAASSPSDKIRPWFERYGENYVAIVDALVEGDLLFLCSAVEGLIALELSGDMDASRKWHLGPDHPEFKRFPVSGKPARCGRLVASGPYLYALHYGDTFLSPSYMAIYDLTIKPPRLHHIELETGEGGFMNVAAGPHHLYAAMGPQGVQRFKLGHAGIERLGGVKGIDQAWDIVIWGGRLYVAMGEQGLAALSLDQPEKPTIMSILDLKADVRRLAMHRWTTTLFLAAGSRGVVGVNMRNPRKPELLEWVDTPGVAHGLTVQRDFLAVADWESVRVFDLKAPNQPKLKAVRRFRALSGGGLTLAVASRPGELYLGDWYGLERHRVRMERSVPILETELGRLSLKREGESYVGRLELRNDGEAPLKIGEIRASRPHVSVSPAQLEIPPGQTRTLVVSSTSFPSGAADVTLEGPTNDPEFKSLRLKVGPPKPSPFGGDWVQSARLRSLDGAITRIADLKGEVVLLAYFATFCPPCWAEFPELERLLWRPLKSQGLKLFGVTGHGVGPRDDQASVQRFAKHTGATFPLAFALQPPPAGLATKGSAISYFPFHILIDAKGVIRHAGAGTDLDALEKIVRQALREAKSGK